MTLQQFLTQNMISLKKEALKLEKKYPYLKKITDIKILLEHHPLNKFNKIKTYLTDVIIIQCF